MGVSSKEKKFKGSRHANETLIQAAQGIMAGMRSVDSGLKVGTINQHTFSISKSGAAITLGMVSNTQEVNVGDSVSRFSLINSSI